MDFFYITEKEELISVCEELSKENILGIDLECENNLHHYGVYISIIQISSRKKNYIIDVLKLKKIDCFLKILENRDIQKIFHDINFDLRVLKHIFKCSPKNIFDTQMAMQFLGYDSIGLEAVLKNFYDVQKNCKFQMADWTKRPIKKSMLEYAINDTIYLIKVKEKLEKELKKDKRWVWFKEEMSAVDNINLTLKELSFDEMKGIMSLTPNELSVAKALYELRNVLAKKINRAQHFLFNNKKLLDMSREPPKSLKEWETMSRVHPIVKSSAKRFFDAVSLAKKDSFFLKKETIKKYTMKEKERVNYLTNARIEISDKLKIARNIILSKEEIKQIVLTNKFDFLKHWQKEILKNYL